MKLPTPIERTLEWVLRLHALREAVAERDQAGTERRAALDQARLLLEVARRVAEPAETLPRGSRPAVLLDLYRSAATWALRALGAGAPLPLAELWAEVPPERLRAGAGDDAALSAVRDLLSRDPDASSLAVPDESVRLLRTFAEALVHELDAPDRKVERRQIERWTRVALVAALVGAIVVGTPRLLRGPDLAKDRPFKLSSVYGGCDDRRKCGELMFHTENEPNPWMTLDLGGPKTVRSVEVMNRTDCCAERAVPLVVELSQDNRNFNEVARRDANFSSWTAKFKPKKARYVRFRSLHTTALHFENVVVR